MNIYAMISKFAEHYIIELDLYDELEYINSVQVFSMHLVMARAHFSEM